MWHILPMEPCSSASFTKAVHLAEPTLQLVLKLPELSYRYVSYFVPCRESGLLTTPFINKPGNDRLIVSNRGDNIFGHGNDSIAVFFLPDLAQDDEVSFLGLYPAYGSFPRQFEFSPDGDMLAVALQNSHQVAVIEWDVKHGLPGRLLSNVTLEGEVPAVVWDM